MYIYERRQLASRDIPSSRARRQYFAFSRTFSFATRVPLARVSLQNPVEAPVERRSSWAKNINVAAILRWRTEVSPLDDEYEE